MYLYTAHRAKSTFHMAKATLTLKKQPTEQAHISYFFRPGLLLHSCTTQRTKWLHSTLTKHGHFYTQTQLREQSVHIIQANQGCTLKQTHRANRLLSILAMNSHSYTQKQLRERGVHSILTTTAIFTQHILPTEGTFHTAKNHSCTLIHNTHSKAFLYTSIYVNSFTSIIAQ